ncbi:hypothetical protein [Lysinibacillus boronitolerans]|uniref:hypothetical protein n=1 Tax=Lysinibacillus boronitolerans TaxID=309788 RepID=UPI00037B7A00|nr:hypothetical protein [Lysinibacillus boronitolerans]
MALIRGYVRLLEDLTSNWLNVVSVIVLAVFVSWYSVDFNNGLPKPETIFEFGKYYFGSPGPYLFGLSLNFISSIAVITLGLSFIYFSFRERYEYQTWFLVATGITGFTLLFISLYFWSYFLLLLITLIVIAIICYFVLSALADDRR